MNKMLFTALLVLSTVPAFASAEDATFSNLTCGKISLLGIPTNGFFTAILVVVVSVILAGIVARLFFRIPLLGTIFFIMCLSFACAVVALNSPDVMWAINKCYYHGNASFLATALTWAGFASLFLGLVAFMAMSEFIKGFNSSE